MEVNLVYIARSKSPELCTETLSFRRTEHNDVHTHGAMFQACIHLVCCVLVLSHSHRHLGCFIEQSILCITLPFGVKMLGLSLVFIFSIYILVIFQYFQ